MQGFTFEASDRSRSLSLTQINNLGSGLSLASVVKIARCLQVFVLTSSSLSHDVLAAQFIKSYQMSGLTSMCIMFKCHIMLYVELNKIRVQLWNS